MRFGKVFYAIILFLCIFDTGRLWKISPDLMAAHFNAQGSPDRFVPRADFFAFQIKTLLVMIVVSLAMQLLFFIIPIRIINMPNRKYWLAPDRRDNTLDRLSSFAALVFGMILLMIQAAFEISVYANLQTPVIFNAQLMALVVLVSILVIGLALALLVRSFRNIPAQK